MVSQVTGRELVTTTRVATHARKTHFVKDLTTSIVASTATFVVTDITKTTCTTRAVRATRAIAPIVAIGTTPRNTLPTSPLRTVDAFFTAPQKKLSTTWDQAVALMISYSLNTYD